MSILSSALWRRKGEERVENPDTLQPCDFMLSDFDEGATVLFPKSDAGCQWVADHLPADVPMHGAGVEVKHDVLVLVVDEIFMDGLSIS